MTRIRSVKPEFFRHELLQDLETKHLGCFPMLVFEGLWAVSDKHGRFEWRPKQLKLDILPFLAFDFETTLEILVTAKMVRPFVADGQLYGFIPTFDEHQRISGSEKKNAAKYPTPTEADFLTVEALRKHRGSTEDFNSAKHETPRKRQGSQERERERITGKGIVSVSTDEVSQSDTPSDEPDADLPTNWAAILGDDWRAIVGGLPNYGKIGKAIKPLIRERGLAVVRPAWVNFAHSPKHSLGPSFFVENFGDYDPTPRLFDSHGDEGALLRAAGWT